MSRIAYVEFLVKDLDHFKKFMEKNNAVFETRGNRIFVSFNSSDSQSRASLLRGSICLTQVDEGYRISYDEDYTDKLKPIIEEYQVQYVTDLALQQGYMITDIHRDENGVELTLEV